MARQINAEGLELIKTFEGLMLEAYLDPVGIWTIGYGHVQGVKPGDRITEQEAEDMLAEDLDTYERGVENLVKVSLNDNEFSALVAFTYNVGVGALKGSTALKRLNANNRLGAAEALEWWNKGRVNGKLFILPGLVRRRAAEKALFLKPVSVDPSKLGQTTSVSPDQKETPNGRDNLASSRTIQGGTVAGAAAAAGAVGAGSQMATKDETAADSGTTTPPTGTDPGTTPPAGTEPPPATTPDTTPPATTTPPASTDSPTPPASTDSPTPPATTPPSADTPPDPGISLPPGVSAPSSPTPPADSAPPSPTTSADSPPSASAPAAAPEASSPSAAATATASPPAAGSPDIPSAAATTTSTGKEPPTIVKGIASIFDDNPDLYPILFGVIVLAAIYILWARLDDWKNGRR